MKTLEKIIPKRKTRNVIETSYEIISEVDVRDDELNSDTSLSYDLAIRYIGGGIFTNWEKSNFQINGSKSFTKIDEIYLKVSNPVNALHFYYKKGLISEIKNYKEILEKWEVSKKQVINEFYGEVLNVIVEKTDQNYNDEERLCQLLSRDLVLQHLYTGTELDDELIYTSSSKSKRRFLGVFDEIPVTYYETRTLSNIGDQLRIKGEGKQKFSEQLNPLLEEYFKRKIEHFKVENLQSTLKTDYIIDPDSLWVNEAVVTHDIQVLDSNYQKKITLRIKRK